MRAAAFIAIVINVLLVNASWAGASVSQTAAPVVEAKVGDCRFKYRDLYKGYRDKEPSGYYGEHPFYQSMSLVFDFVCRPFEESDNGQPAQSYAYIDIDKDVNNGAMRDPVSGKWLIHPIEVGPADEAFIENPVQAKLLAKSRFGGQLDAINSTGYYRVENATMGEETRRERFFSACLMHPPVVLCISRTNAGSLKEPKRSLVPYLVKLLQTVEFVE